MKELSIGQMARLNGLSEQTLRLYDKAGLFSPMYRDAETATVTMISARAPSWI